MNREEFLAERRTGIGSSDAAALMNVGYGCRRRLWYDKVGIPADYEREMNDAMELGQILEPFFIKKYVKKTGHIIFPTGQSEAFRHPQYPFIMSHPDGAVYNISNGIITGAVTRTLEVKSMDRGAFFKTKREGLMEDYILQKQWTMAVIGNQVGGYAVGNRGSGELLEWDIERNEPLITLLIEAGREFWEEVKEGRNDQNDSYAPLRLSPDDARCHRCEWRDSCQGNALMEISKKDDGTIAPANDLFPLYQEYKERAALLKDAEDLLDETKEELKTKLGDRPAVSVNGRKIYYRPQTSMRWDGEELFQYSETLRGQLRDINAGMSDEEFNRLYPKMEKKPSISRPLRIF